MGMFTKATKKQARLRLALIGPSGSGKTYTSLELASRLGARVAVIDSERGSASKYAGPGLFEFDVLELSSFSPTNYVKAIQAAEAEGYDVIVVDSLSHAWIGREGALEQVDRVVKRSQSGSSFNAWREVTPMHNALVDAIIRSKCHIIATMRAKTEYVLEKDKTGKTAPRKVGLAPVQRDSIEFEFDVVGDMTVDNDLLITKTRCPALTGGVFSKPGEDVAAILLNWLGQGAPADKPEDLPQTSPEPWIPAPGASAVAQNDYAAQIHGAQSIESLKTISADIAKNVIKGDARRPKLAKLLADRKAEIDKASVQQLPPSDTNTANGSSAQEHAA